VFVLVLVLVMVMALESVLMLGSVLVNSMYRAAHRNTQLLIQFTGCFELNCKPTLSLGSWMLGVVSYQKGNKMRLKSASKSGRDVPRHHELEGGPLASCDH
jgi:hypothetical protein